ncbi:hypothetical protein [Micromonospora sp. Llam0]|uniref:hypothetical protein n=1 Tax=Micromonospora sp. Llam0 TaxID=2485143 RepID=UPI001F373854|nr:hypothetical protein [Micromonospora sp. Llam0]
MAGRDKFLDQGLRQFLDQGLRQFLDRGLRLLAERRPTPGGELIDQRPHRDTHRRLPCRVHRQHHAELATTGGHRSSV